MHKLRDGAKLNSDHKGAAGAARSPQGWREGLVRQEEDNTLHGGAGSFSTATC